MHYSERLAHLDFELFAVVKPDALDDFPYLFTLDIQVVGDFFRKLKCCLEHDGIPLVITTPNIQHANEGVGAWDGALSEGLGDILAMLITHDHGMARGFFLSNPSWRNVAMLGCAIGFNVLRALAEEKVLLQDPAYKEYARRVRRRFIPFIV